MNDQPNYARMPGMGDLPGDNLNPNSPDYDDRFDIAVAELTDAWMQDANKLYEAEEWVAGTHSGDHYTEVTLALAAFHETHPADLSGSEALARVYRIAKVEHDALYGRMRDMAEAELQKGVAA